MTPVQIDEVALESGSEMVAASGLDTPASGLESPFYGIDVRGWAIGRSGPVFSAVVRHGATELRRVPVDIERPDVEEQHPEREWARQSGFFAPIGALRLDPEFELDLEVELDDEVLARLGSIKGRRAPLRTSFDPRLEPIGLTALGRTGSTAVVHLIASHPDVIAYRPFEYEPRVVTYWLDALRDLSEPAAFRRQVTPLGPLDEGWWTGTRPPYPRRLKDIEMQAVLGGENAEELALFSQRRIERFYVRVAELSGRPDPTRFVEKVDPRTAALLRELYPSAREVVLVRDFRDMVASILAFNRKRGFAGFGRDRAGSDADYVATRVATSVQTLADAWRARSRDAHLLRYEDLVLQPRDAVAGMLDYLGLDAPARTIDAMVASLQNPQSDVHRTIAAAEHSIGRWRQDLPAEVQEACADALGPALRQFGYEDGSA
jgi:hypothetical protein